MKKVILKRNPTKKTFFDYIKILFNSVFKERVFITHKNGKLCFYHLSPILQFFIVLFLGFIIYWSIFTTKLYFLNSEILKEKDNLIQDARKKFNRTVVDIKAYRDIIESINDKIETSQKNIVSLLEKNENISKLDKDNLIKNQLLLSTELKYVNSSLNDFTKGITWSSVDTKDPIYKTTKNELEKNVVLNENIFLKERNSKLENSLNDMRELQTNLIDKVMLLADNKIDDIEKTLSKIDIVLSQVNLKNRNTLIKKVKAENNEGLGGKYIPLKDIELSDEELNEKFKNANIRVNLWEGLSKAKNMLPLGAPVKTRIRITSPFGVRSDPFLKTPAMHTGIDFGGKMGTPLYATASGKVIQAGPRGDYGLAVEVDHGLGFSTLYAHLSKVNVEKGDVIDEGTKVGLAGSTGRSTGVHLHYELRHNKRALNPYAFVKVENK
ncbi:peptidoglycan DD-metalloendopeptidase family protein [bacterium]|nr:peptidoglycan DD-metalloendopeptidase family protein [bacterium]